MWPAGHSPAFRDGALASSGLVIQALGYAREYFVKPSWPVSACAARTFTGKLDAMGVVDAPIRDGVGVGGVFWNAQRHATITRREKIDRRISTSPTSQ